MKEAKEILVSLSEIQELIWTSKQAIRDEESNLKRLEETKEKRFLRVLDLVNGNA